MGKKDFYSQVKDLISRYNPDILTCMETSVNTSRALEIIENISMLSFLKIPLIGFSGGIWLIWQDNAELQVTIVETHDTFIHCHIKDNKKNTHWLMTFISYLQDYLQKQIWKLISI